MKRKQRPNVSLLLWLTKEFIILSILSNLVCTALYMAASWLLTGTPIPASHSSGLGPLLFLIGSTVILGCGLNYRFNQFLTGLAGGLRGGAGFFPTRVTASPVASSRTVRIVLFWKLDNWRSTPCEAPIRCELRITREVCTPDPSR